MATKSLKIIFIIIGLLLALLQFINFCGVSRMDTGLFPNNDHLLYPTYSIERTELNVKMVFFAFSAGFDRFGSGFEDLTYPEDEYRVNSSTQITSALIRESKRIFGV